MLEINYNHIDAFIFRNVASHSSSTWHCFYLLKYRKQILVYIGVSQSAVSRITRSLYEKRRGSRVSFVPNNRILALRTVTNASAVRLRCVLQAAHTRRRHAPIQRRSLGSAEHTTLTQTHGASVCSCTQHCKGAYTLCRFHHQLRVNLYCIFK